MSTKAVLSNALYDACSIESAKKRFNQALPFRHIRLTDFLHSEFVDKLQQSLDDDITFQQKDCDLYRFLQSYELQQSEPQFTAIHDLIETLYSKQFVDVLHQITGIKVNQRPNLFASCYTDTSYLLCHDDQVQDRAIAFILYLVPSDWNTADGGALNLYDSYTAKGATDIIVSSSNASTKGDADKKIRVNLFPENQPSLQLVPERNSVVIFEVSDTSFHAVDEVLNADKKRIAIGGWWHTDDVAVHSANEKKVAVPDPMIVWKESLELQQQNDLLSKWLNPTYLKPECMQQLQAKFVEDSHLTLMDFLNDALYYPLLQQLFAVQSQTEMEKKTQKRMFWKLKGPIHLKLYNVLQSNNKEECEDDKYDGYELIEEFQCLLQSVQWKTFIAKITSLDLMQHNTECRKFGHRNYTIAHDLDRVKDTAGLDVNFQFVENEGDGWDPAHGGSIYYTLSSTAGNRYGEDVDVDGDDEDDEDDDEADDDEEEVAVNETEAQEEKEDDDEDQEAENGAADVELEDDNILMSVHTFPNALSIVYRSEPGVMSFVKYVNHRINGNSKIDYNQIWSVNAADDSASDQDGDGEQTESNNDRKRERPDEQEVAPPTKKQKL